MKRILLAEDEEAVRRYLAVLLEKNSYEVVAVDNGKKALELIDASINGLEKPYDLLVTDVDMPLMGGFELLDEINKRNIYLPSIIITGQDDREVVLKALRKGCHEFIDKPLVVNDVLTKVESTLLKIVNRSKIKTASDFISETHKLQKAAGLSATETDKLTPSRTIGKFRIIKVIGEGGVGTVFLCKNPEDNQNYALKTLRLRSTAAADKESSIRRLINEGNAISQLNHPNIVNFIEFGYSGTGTGRMPYIVMEYFPGKSLKYYLENPMELSIKKKIKIIIQIADALQAAHTKNIFHRDIKPDNILVDKKLNVKLTDFGICHLPTSDVTRTSELMGSPGYMAPEYLQYGKTDKLMDIYSLGVVSYELFVGVRPFDANNLTELMNKIIKKHPAEPRKLVPDFPEKLQDIIAKMMKKNPKRRYNDASEIIDELNKVLEESPETGFFKRTITKIFYKDWN